MSKNAMNSISRLINKHADILVSACGHEEYFVRAEIVKKKLMELIRDSITEEPPEARSLHVAALEFVQDWKKGDFELPTLAKHDANALIEACQNYARLLEGRK